MLTPWYLNMGVMPAGNVLHSRHCCDAILQPNIFKLVILTWLLSSSASRCTFLILFMWLGVVPSVVAQTWVYHSKPESAADARLDYPIALLHLCLAKSGGDYQLKQNDTAMQQGRSLRLLEQGQGIDVVWTLTSIERERRLLPIRIPIDRGLIGWRLLLIRSGDKEFFSQISTVQELAKLRAGQGHDWPDTQVLRENNFNVSTGSSYEGLFAMLSRGHSQYFPRSISEIWPEVATHSRNFGLEVEPKWAFHYPAAMYYFVKKDNHRLAVAIEKGLRQALADGSMKQLFDEYYGVAIARARLSERHVIELKNSELPVATPLAESSLWFDLGELAP